MKLRISHKVALVGTLAVAGMFALSLLMVFALRDSMVEDRQLKTRHVVESAHSIIAHFARREQAGTLSREDAQAAAADALRELRYGDSDYVWINDMAPVMVMHPFKPELEGKALGEVRDPTGKALFRAFVETVERDGAGFVDYHWPKPGASEPVPKLSYVKGFAPWGWLVGSGIYMDDVDATVLRRSLEVFSLLALVAAVFGLVMWLLVRRILARIGRLHDAARALGDSGVLSNRIPQDGNDELGDTAAAFNTVMDRMQAFVRDVNAATVDLASGGEEMSMVSNQTLHHMETLRADTEQVATAMTELAAAAGEVSRNVGDAAEAALRADEESVRGSQVVTATTDSIRTLSRSIEEAAQVVHRLAEDARDISGILDVIQGIADQTNLLALNAAIEAARAGEQGRGFSVVADEVRTLAQRTRESTEEIRAMIERLQNGATSAVGVMERSMADTSATVEQAQATGTSLQAIAAAASTISRLNAQIASAAREQSTVAEDINRNLVSIRSIADETVGFSERTTSVSGTLSEVMTNLTDLVRRYHTTGAGTFDFANAKSMHLNWKARLRAFLDGKSQMDEAQAVSHKHCQLGRWYHGDGLAHFGHIEQMQALEAPHAELHALIGQIIAAKNAGDTDHAEALFQDIEPLSRQIVSLLDAVDQELNAA